MVTSNQLYTDYKHEKDKSDSNRRTDPQTAEKVLCNARPEDG
jgi:hypothetical protein